MSTVSSATAMKSSPVLSKDKSRKDPKPLIRTIFDVALGTSAGVGVRYLGMPIEAVFTKGSFHDCTKSNWQLVKETIFDWKEFRHLQTTIFSRTCLRQSAYKSLSNAGVITWIESTYPDLSPFKRGTAVIILSTVLETITTTPGEWNKILALQDKSLNKSATMFNAFRFENLCNPNYHRCLRATFIRSAWSGVFTYGGIYGLERCITPFYPDKEHSTYVKVFSAALGSMIPQVIIMPGVNLQTYVFRNPKLPWKESFKQYLSDYKVEKITDIHKLSKAWEIRAMHRGITYALAFSFTELLKRTQ